jgi:tetratricopeptide (TPR) repeat protein
VWLAAAGNGLAKTDAEKMNEGNAAYRAGNWSLAIEIYSRISVNNAGLFYNLANAHFKNGETGKAIVYYNRALKINPRDDEIRANLEYARLTRTDKTEIKKQTLLMKIIETPFRTLSMNEHAVLAILFFTLLLGLLFGIAGLPEGKTRARLKNAAAAATILLVVQATVTGIKTYSENAIRYGVVTTKMAVALSSPSAGSERVFELHDGAEVVLGRAENGFIFVKLPTGWTGWLPENSIEKI